MIVGIARAVVLPTRGPQISTATSSQPWNSSRSPATVRAIGRPGVSTPSRAAVAAAPFRVSAPSSRGPAPSAAPPGPRAAGAADTRAPPGQRPPPRRQPDEQASRNHCRSARPAHRAPRKVKRQRDRVPRKPLPPARAQVRRHVKHAHGPHHRKQHAGADDRLHRLHAPPGLASPSSLRVCLHARAAQATLRVP